MPLLDDFLLPKHIRTMEPMQDLLSAEQQELTAVQAELSHQNAQLYISTADDELPRYERSYALPTNPALPVEERRRRIIAKANARASATIAYLKETIENLTGHRVTIKELYSEYTLQFSIYLNDKYVLDIPMVKAQIKELRPAHLLFEVLPVAQITVDIPLVIGTAVGVHKEYVVCVKWLAAHEQQIVLRQICKAPAQSHKNYEIEVN